MIYVDRVHAGQVLAQKLKTFKKYLDNTLVAAIPRGGVVVGQEISREYKLPIIPLVIKKIGAPSNPELAIGAVASFGKPVLDRWLIADLQVTPTFIRKETSKKKKEAKAREIFLGYKVGSSEFKGKNVIVVDDGIATGQTVKMAAKILRQLGADKLILAAGCAPTSVVEQIKGEYDEIICPETREDFMAVGQFYRDFKPVEDEKVRDILNQNAKLKDQN